MNYISINSTPWRNVDREGENGSYLYFFLLKVDGFDGEYYSVTVSELLLYHWYYLLLVCECMWDCEHCFYFIFIFLNAITYHFYDFTLGWSCKCCYLNL